MDIDEDDNEPEDEQAGPSGAAHLDAEEQPMQLFEENEVVKEEEIDPALADWFKVDEEKDAHPTEHGGEEDSVTEDDSDNADVAGEPEEHVDLDDWFKVKAEDAAEGSSATGVQPKVGFISLSSSNRCEGVNFRRISTSRWGKAKMSWNTTRNIFSNICMLF